MYVYIVSECGLVLIDVEGDTGDIVMSRYLWDISLVEAFKQLARSLVRILRGIWWITGSRVWL